MLTAKIHSIETGGTVDGPGIRYIVFFQGCPLRCLYCHNPDTWKMEEGKDYELYELFNDIKKYTTFMKFSGGGITASGGEPLMQAEFVKELFKLCRQSNISTALDTSGSILNDKVKEVLEYTDIVLLDIKQFDRTGFKSLTSKEPDTTLSFAEYIAEKNICVWLRYVLVPGLTDNIAQISEMADYVKKLGNVERVDILPFHKMGEYKWKELGYDYKLWNTREPSEELIEKVKIVFKDKGFSQVY